MVSHDGNVLQHTIYELRAVTSAHEQLLDAWAKETAFDLQVRPSLVPFGIDHLDSTGTYGYVVDVGLRTRVAAVTEDCQAFGKPRY